MFERFTDKARALAEGAQAEAQGGHMAGGVHHAKASTGPHLSFK